jgi:serine/threonine-protein kinase
LPDPITRLNAALAGRYSIERELGEGGMATVYLAADLKHERSVALKVLKPELAAVVGAERFLTEIKTTANLQHPHILPLFDSGEADSFLFYVMPYVQGETLRARLDREKQLPVDEAIRIATDVAEALDAAHAQGVIHRDIKPANLLLSNGRPLVADFGIALAVSAAGGGRLTETGLSLGTPHYMSPEQATGEQSVSAATDIYALGAVLYEMLVGDPPHTGSTAQAILGKIIVGAPVTVAEHRASVPAHVDGAIRKALEKLPADRFASTRDFARALADPGFRYGSDDRLQGEPVRGLWNVLSMATTAVAVVMALALGWALLSPTSPDSSSNGVVRFTVPVGEDADVFLGGELGTEYGYPAATALAISPDGSQLVYSAWDRDEEGSQVSRLYRRRLGQERADPLAGTEGASGPFFSSTGEWVGFFTPAGLKRVSVENGDVERVGQGGGQLSARVSATWGDDGTIVVSNGQSLYTDRLTSDGGMEVLLPADTVLPGMRYSHPHMLPGSRKMLVTGRPWSVDPALAGVFVLDLETLQRTSLVENAMNPIYAEPGYLLFVRQGNLMAVRFDAARGEISGDQKIVIEDVMQAVGMPNSDHETGTAQVAISLSGTLAYARGGTFPGQERLAVRVAPDGTAEPLDMPVMDYSGGRVSPGGDRLALTVYEGRSSTILVHDLNRRVTERLDGGGFEVAQPEWSPDGREIAYQSDHVDGVKNIYRILVDGSGEPERVAPADRYQAMLSWSATGVIAYQQDGDIWVVPPGAEPRPFLVSEEVRESHATFSPNGRWVAYVSGGEVYVRPYPGPEPATRVSDGGGNAPVWSRDGRRLFFRRGPIATRELLATEVGEEEGEFRASPPEVLIDSWRYQGYTPMRSHDVLADGSFLAIANKGVLEEGGGVSARTADRFRVETFHIVLNFLEELRAEMRQD